MAQQAEAPIEPDSVIFARICRQMERELGRELTPDEVRALRLSYDAVDPPVVIERRRPDDDEPETEAAKAGE